MNKSNNSVLDSTRIKLISASSHEKPHMIEMGLMNNRISKFNPNESYGNQSFHSSKVYEKGSENGKPNDYNCIENVNEPEYMSDNNIYSDASIRNSYNNLCQEYSIIETMQDLERILHREYKENHEEHYSIHNPNFQVSHGFNQRDEKRKSVHEIENNIVLESSILLSDYENRKEKDGKDRDSETKIIEAKNESYYFECILNIIFMKFKTTQTEFEIETQKVNQDYILFINEIKDLIKKITENIAIIKYKQESILNVNKNEKGNLEFKDIHFFNKENIILKILILKLVKYPTDRIYSLWKFHVLKLVSKWKFDQVNISMNKYKLKYLKIKLLFEKLIKSKENRSIDTNFNQSIVYKLSKRRNLIKKVFGCCRVNKSLPKLTSSPTSSLIVFFDLLIDTQILFFLLICPVILLMKLRYSLFIIIEEVFNVIYFFNLILVFRSSFYDLTNNINYDLFYLFKTNLMDFRVFFDLVSLFPVNIFYSNVSSLYLNNDYFFLKQLLLLRTFRFGRCAKYFEKTKFYLIYKLVMLIIKFLVISHILGLIFMFFNTSLNFSDPEYMLDSSCINSQSGVPILSASCELVISLYNGGYIVPGNYFAGLTLIETYSTYIQEYIILFVAYFIGQITTAYIFGGVSDIIRNFNQAENIYREKFDNIRSVMSIYQFNTEVLNDIQLYYEYIWIKHRNIAYGSDLLFGLTDTLYKQLIEHKIFYHNIYFKEFYDLSQNKESKLISTIIKNMNSYISFPFERICTQGQTIKGLFILLDGVIHFTDGVISKEDEYDLNESFVEKIEHDEEETKNNLTISTSKIQINKGLILKNLEKNSTDDEFASQSLAFPIDALFLKTGRSIETCYSDDFCDLYFLPLSLFDENLFINFPREMNKLKEKAKTQGMKKIGEGKRIKEMIFKHSSRSVNKLYEKIYTIDNIWIDIQDRIPMVNENNEENFYVFLKFPSGVFDINYKSIRKLYQSMHK